MHFKNLAIIATTFIVALSACTNNSSSNNRANPLLLISFDGFRNDYLQKTATPNFDAFAAEGVQAQGLIPVFPSKTFPNHYSIVTGLYPENSGLLDNNMYDKQRQQWYRISKRSAVENAGWYNGEPIWNTAEKQGLKAGTMFWVGSAAAIQGMRPTHWKRFDSEEPGRARIDTVVQWLSTPDTAQQVDLATLYFEDVDAVGHYNGTQSRKLAAAISRADSLLGYLKKQLQAQELWNTTNIIILSDHGMIDLDAEKTITLDAIIDTSAIERKVLGPVTMIEPKAGRTNQLYRSLKNAEQHFAIYKREELPERYHFNGSPRAFGLIMVADPAYTILTEDYRAQFEASLPAATHGYAPEVPEMQALFMARGPAFKNGQRVDAFQNIHIYELMTHILNLEPALNDGDFDAVLPLLNAAAEGQ